MQTITITTSNPSPQIAQAISAFMQIIDPTHKIEQKSIETTQENQQTNMSKEDVAYFKAVVKEVEKGTAKTYTSEEFAQRMRAKGVAW